MEHKKLDQLRSVADVKSPDAVRTMSRTRTHPALDRPPRKVPDRRLNAIPEIEYMLPADRAGARADDSPLSVAFADPVFRTEGLASDTLGDAMKFFELTENGASCLLLLPRRVSDGIKVFARRLNDATIGRSRIVSGAWLLGGMALLLPGLIYLG